MTANRGGITPVCWDNPAALRWRSQFASSPAGCYPSFHGIAKHDHGLINVFPNEKNGMGVQPLPVSREATE
jgi:hypothetical protein